ncbi:MAG: patatin-like phospholipase family protein, partial [Candidatus Omnitrophica bacterium]|nr:patatin-like phospholipase family protein [Candidatus Omnitrophota bacterium]
NKPAALSSEEQGRLLGHNVLAALPKIQPRESARLFMDKPACEYAKTLRRISRQEGNCLVGLALGIGVAYGFCHIGVLKVIEEEKIPIDVISGSSMGAVIAGLWATGKTAQEILEITRDFKDPKHIWGVLDFAFPLLGFIKGDKLYNFLKRHLGNKTFYDLKIPLKIIASDIKKKEPKLLDQGLVVDAIMASCSMPGVFKPFKFKDQTLFDGGVTHPLPTEPLFEMGVKKIIAVNVTPSRADVLKQYEKIKEIVTSGKGLDKKKWFDLKYYFIDRFKDNILDIIFSSVEVLQSAVAQKEAQIADIVLHPDLTGLHWLEFHKVEEFVKIGEAETRKHLDKILKLVNE